MTTKKEAEKFVEQAFVNEIEAKAALIVIHRVVRSMDDPNPVKQRDAMDKLMKFADAHPLPSELERLL